MIKNIPSLYGEPHCKSAVRLFFVMVNYTIKCNTFKK